MKQVVIFNKNKSIGDWEMEVNKIINTPKFVKIVMLNDKFMVYIINH